MEIDKQNESEIYMEYKEPRIAKTILKKNRAGRITLPYNTPDCKSTVTQTVWYFGPRIDK